MPMLERIFDWSVRRIFKGNFEFTRVDGFKVSRSTSPLNGVPGASLRAPHFCGRVRCCSAHRTDVSGDCRVHSLSLLRKGPMPFVIGPLQSVASPGHQDSARLENAKQWISGLRNLYRFLPFARSTYRHAAAIIAASSQACAEFAAVSRQGFLCPGTRDRRFPYVRQLAQFGAGRPNLELIFVGGLVPGRLVISLCARLAPLLRNGLAQLHGDRRWSGTQPSRAAHKVPWGSGSGLLPRLVQPRGSPQPHAHLRMSWCFPRVRENGAGVVFEALASGAVPVVTDFGGPGDIVHPRRLDTRCL